MRFEEVKLKTILKRFMAALALVVTTIIIEFMLLRTLSVYNTTIGTFLLVRDLLAHSAVLVFASSVLLYFVGFFRNTVALGACYFLIGVGCLVSFVLQMNSGLGMDVTYTWVLNKSGLDILKLQYLGGWSIAFIFILVALLFLSDPRLSYEKGNDGKRYLYVHSKLIGLI
ncbi:MAG: hypothetical protein ACUVUE_04450 [Candidatus Bathycorpusculaceae bacterium]